MQSVVIEPKFTIYAKKQENMTDNENKNQSIKTDAELMQVAEFADKSIKIVIKMHSTYSKS